MEKFQKNFLAKFINYNYSKCKLWNFYLRNTPLHWAVVQSNHTAVSALLKLNVNLLPMNKVTGKIIIKKCENLKENETPLDIAKRKGDLLSVRLIEMAARERGVLPSKFRQKLRENKVFKFKINFKQFILIKENMPDRHFHTTISCHFSGQFNCQFANKLHLKI
jgi:ankyrin repeat protein